MTARRASNFILILDPRPDGHGY